MTNKMRLEKLEKRIKLIVVPLWDLKKLTERELLDLESIVIKITEKDNQELTDRELINLERMFSKATGEA